MVKKKKGVQDVAAIAEPIPVGTVSEKDFRAILDEIKTYKGVVGYILRNSTSAAINLRDPTKIIDYAILSSSALNVGEEFSELFNLGAIKNIVVEGKDVKMLSLTIDENKISIFMEKTVDCGKILKKLHAL